MAGFLPHLPALVVLLPLFCACLCALLLKRLSVLRVVYATFVLLMVISSIALVYRAYNNGSLLYQMGGWLPTIGISFYVNIQSAMMVFIISVGFAISSVGLLNASHLPRSILCFACLVFTGLVGLCVSADLFNTYVFMELSSIATYIITSFSDNNRTTYKVALDYLILGSVAGIFVLLGVLVIYVATGSLSMLHLSNVLLFKDYSGIDTNGIPLMQCGYLLMLSGFVLKAGLYPMHTLSVKTYTVASSSIASFLSSTVTKVYAFLIYKVSSVFMANSYTATSVIHVSQILSFMGLCGIIAMGASNIGENHVRKEIAVSSCIQVCYFIIGFFMFTNTAATGVLLQMLIHTISISTLFLIMDKSFYEMDAKYSPRTTGETPKYFLTRSTITKISSVILLLNVAGYPMTVGFIAKWMMLDSTVSSYRFISFALLFVGSGIGMLYTWRIIERILLFHHRKAKQTKTLQKTSIQVVSIISVVLAFVLGQFFLNDQFSRVGTENIGYFHRRLMVDSDQ